MFVICMTYFTYHSKLWNGVTRFPCNNSSLIFLIIMPPCLFNFWTLQPAFWTAPFQFESIGACEPCVHPHPLLLNLRPLQQKRSRWSVRSGSDVQFSNNHCVQRWVTSLSWRGVYWSEVVPVLPQNWFHAECFDGYLLASFNIHKGQVKCTSWRVIFYNG